MKTKTILLLVVVLFSIKHIKAQNSMSLKLSAGYNGTALAYNLGINLLGSNDNYYSIDLYYSNEDIKQTIYTIPYELMLLNVDYNLSLIDNPKSNFTMSAGVGVVGGIERLNKGNKSLFNNAELSNTGGIVYGPNLSVNVGYIISNHFDIIINNKTDYFINSSVGNFNNVISLGIRINL